MKKLLLLALPLLGACASGSDLSMADLGFGEVHRTTPKVAVNGPLGSKGNPVRVLMPTGEREYLHRLRCDNGAPPDFERLGSADLSPYGTIMDIYSVRCKASNTEAQVYMDMYHCEQETQPVPGFEIVPAIGAPAASDQCN